MPGRGKVRVSRPIPGDGAAGVRVYDPFQGPGPTVSACTDLFRGAGSDGVRVYDPFRGPGPMVAACTDPFGPPPRALAR